MGNPIKPELQVTIATDKTFCWSLVLSLNNLEILTDIVPNTMNITIERTIIIIVFEKVSARIEDLPQIE
nr:hypothetical protein [uncultured Mogibacterium sp.]